MDLDLEQLLSAIGGDKGALYDPMTGVLEGSEVEAPSLQTPQKTEEPQTSSLLETLMKEVLYKTTHPGGLISPEGLFSLYDRVVPEMEELKDGGTLYGLRKIAENTQELPGELLSELNQKVGQMNQLFESPEERSRRLSAEEQSPAQTPAAKEIVKALVNEGSAESFLRNGVYTLGTNDKVKAKDGGFTASIVPNYNDPERKIKEDPLGYLLGKAGEGLSRGDNASAETALRGVGALSKGERQETTMEKEMAKMVAERVGELFRRAGGSNEPKDLVELYKTIKNMKSIASGDLKGLDPETLDGVVKMFSGNQEGAPEEGGGMNLAEGAGTVAGVLALLSLVIPGLKPAGLLKKASGLGKAASVAAKAVGK